MSFDTNYPNRKDRRKPYRGSQSFDRSCRHGGSCPWCERNRTVRDRRLRAAAKLREWSQRYSDHVDKQALF